MTGAGQYIWPCVSLVGLGATQMQLCGMIETAEHVQTLLGHSDSQSELSACFDTHGIRQQMGAQFCHKITVKFTGLAGLADSQQQLMFIH